MKGDTSKRIATFIGTLAFAYLAMSFAYLSVDPNDWSMEARFIAIGFGTWLAFFAACLL